MEKAKPREPDGRPDRLLAPGPWLHGVGSLSLGFLMCTTEGRGGGHSSFQGDQSRWRLLGALRAPGTALGNAEAPAGPGRVRTWEAGTRVVCHNPRGLSPHSRG